MWSSIGGAMAERAEFQESRTQKLVFGVVFLGMAVVWVVILFPTGVSTLTREAAVLLLAIAAFAGAGLWFLSRLRRTGVVVTVDRDGITDLRLGPDPIAWDEVERCALVAGMRGVRHLRLILRPDSQAAARLGKRQVAVNDLVLTGGASGVRLAIARLAPQVPRDW
jgi:hypothetical protein